MAPDVPALLEAPYGAPAADALLRRARTVACILAHGRAKLLIFGRGFVPDVSAALQEPEAPMPFVERDERVDGASPGSAEYIMESAIVAKPDPAWGQRRCGFITLKPDSAQVSAEEIIPDLAHCKAPRTVAFGALPRTFTGKIRKYELRGRAKGVAP
ncbi:MAG: hypothetical protein J2P48_15715 [Alphaproteobacteria bacterium]|nr:hypothetical protein [Alphaproteobacteria bacterium]